MSNNLRRYSAGLLSVCVLLISCRKEKDSPATSAPTGEKQSGTAQRQSIIVSVAASTKEIMETLAAEFKKETKGEVKINPGPSSGLATQIIEGAPVDLFLSANREWAVKVTDAGLTDKSQELLTNKLVMIAPKGNPAGIKEPKDLLSDPVKKVALAAEKVPAGKYADQTLTKLDLREKLAAAGKIVRGQDVRVTLQYVARGEAEAGFVYSTDVNVSNEVEIVHEVDPSLHDEIVYVAVLLKHGSDNPLAQQFFEYLQSDAAAAIYAKAGFSRLTASAKTP